MSSLEEAPYLAQLNPNAINNINIQDLSKSKNIDLFLMEKDKEIINLSNQTKSLKNNLDRLQKIIKEKEMEINSLKSDILTLNNDQKLKEEENILLKNKINSLMQELANAKKETELINSNNNGNMKKISQAFNTKMLEYQKLMKNYNEISGDLNALNEKLFQSEKDNLNNQKLIQDLRKENKKIFLLNKDLTDKDNIIKNLEKNIKDNKEEILELQKEKKFLNDQIQNQTNKEDFMYKTRLSLQEYENAINDMKNNFSKKIKNQELIIKEYQNKIKSYQDNNENLINYIIGQIRQVGNDFEKHIPNPLFNDEILNNLSQPNENDSKFELIHQNFILLSHKLKEFKNNKNAEIMQLKNELDEEQNNKKNLLNNIQLQKMTKNSIENSITELKKIVQIKNDEIRDLNLKLNNLITESTKNNDLKNNQNNLNSEENKLFNEFFQKFVEMVTNFYLENINKKSNLFQIQTFPNFSILDSKQKKLYDILKSTKILIDHTNSISNQLNSIYNNSRVNYSVAKISNINQNRQNNEFNKTIENKDLQKKVKEMSDLLKQSNYYLDISRRENKKIKDKYNALINNFNTMKNMDNSQVQFNSASFEEMKKNNNDISISNPTMSKNFINNSNLAVNQSNPNNQDIYGNNSNSFNINNNEQMNVFNNNANNIYKNQNIQYNMNNNNNMIQNQNQMENNGEEENDDDKEEEYNIENEQEIINNYNQDFQNENKNAENERALNAFINQYTNVQGENNNQQNFGQNYDEAENEQEQEQEENYYDENDGEEEFNNNEEYDEMNYENEEENNYEEEINNDYDDNNNNEQNM